MGDKTELFQCEIVEKELNFVGINITALFPSGFPDAAIKVQQEFMERMNEISNAINKNVLLSPFICNEIIATYFAGLEVSDLNSIPEGMMGFTVPPAKYAKVTCTNKTIGEGYDKVLHWMGENGYIQKMYYAFQIEMYYLDELAEEEQVEILIPIK